MRAFLLAAGLGTRLRPLTDSTPKCLVPIGTAPLLKIWLESLRDCGTTDVLINTHHLPDRVEDFVASWSGPPAIHLAHEETLLGSAGTLRENWDFVSGEKEFLVCYADNLTDVNLESLIAYHRSHTGLVTMALFETDKPRECGIVEVDDGGLVLSFEEKPIRPRSNLANGGIYVMSSEIHRHLPKTTPADIGFDLLPSCAGRMFGWKWPGLLVDIGTPNAYQWANDVWSSRRAE